MTRTYKREVKQQYPTDLCWDCHKFRDEHPFAGCAGFDYYRRADAKDVGRWSSNHAYAGILGRAPDELSPRAGKLSK